MKKTKLVPLHLHLVVKNQGYIFKWSTSCINIHNKHTNSNVSIGWVLLKELGVHFSPFNHIKGKRNDNTNVTVQIENIIITEMLSQTNELLNNFFSLYFIFFLHCDALHSASDVFIKNGKKS